MRAMGIAEEDFTAKSAKEEKFQRLELKIKSPLVLKLLFLGVLARLAVKLSEQTPDRISK